MKITDKMSSLYEKAKSNPLTAAFLGIGATSAALSLTGDTEHLETSINAGLRAVMINSNEIINTGLVPINFVYESVVESGAGFDMIKNDGLAGGLGALGLMIGEAEIKYKKKTTEEKHGLGKGVLILPVAAFLTIAYLLTKDGSSTSHQTPPSPDKIPDNPGLIPTEVATPETYPTDTVEPTENPTETEPTPKETEIQWWDKDPELVYGNHDSSFFGDVEGIKNTENIQNGYYTIMNENGDAIVKHQEYTSDNLDLSHPFYKSFIDIYGSEELVIVEKVDNNLDGKLDQVALYYKGDNGKEFTYFSSKVDADPKRLIWDFMKEKNIA